MIRKKVAVVTTRCLFQLSLTKRTKMIEPLWAEDKPETKASRFVQPGTYWYWQKIQVWKKC